MSAMEANDGTTSTAISESKEGSPVLSSHDASDNDQARMETIPSSSSISTLPSTIPTTTNTPSQYTTYTSSTSMMTIRDLSTLAQNLSIRDEVSTLLDSLISDIEITSTLQTHLHHQLSTDTLVNRCTMAETALEEYRALTLEEANARRELADKFVGELFCLSLRLGELQMWREENEDKVREFDVLKDRLGRAEELVRSYRRNRSIQPGLHDLEDEQLLQDDDAGIDDDFDSTNKTDLDPNGAVHPDSSTKGNDDNHGDEGGDEKGAHHSKAVPTSTVETNAAATSSVSSGEQRLAGGPDAAAGEITTPLLPSVSSTSSIPSTTTTTTAHMTPTTTTPTTTATHRATSTPVPEPPPPPPPTLESMEEDFLLMIFEYMEAFDILNLAQTNICMYSKVDTIFGLGGSPLGSSSSPTRPAHTKEPAQDDNEEEDEDGTHTMTNLGEDTTAPPVVLEEDEDDDDDDDDTDNDDNESLAQTSPSNASSDATVPMDNLSSHGTTTTTTKETVGDAMDIETDTTKNAPVADGAVDSVVKTVNSSTGTAAAATTTTAAAATVASTNNTATIVKLPYRNFSQDSTTTSTATTTTTTKGETTQSSYSKQPSTTRVAGFTDLYSILSNKKPPPPPNTTTTTTTKNTTTATSNIQNTTPPKTYTIPKPTTTTTTKTTNDTGISATMATSLASKLTPAELSAIISLRDKLRSKDEEMSRLVTLKEDLAATLDGTEAVKQFLITKVRDAERALTKSKEEIIRITQQVSSDQEVIAFLDGRVQELEREGAVLQEDKVHAEEMLVKLKEANQKQVSVLSDMLAFEREQLKGSEKEWKATKKVLVKEVKHCRAQIVTLQAERDGFYQQNLKLKDALLALGEGGSGGGSSLVATANGSYHHRDDRSI